MATPVIAALPLAPTRGDGPDDYMVEADAFTAALTPFSIQVNTAVSWMADTMVASLGYKNAAADSAAAAASSALAAAGQVVAAQAQVGLATTQANNAASAAVSAQAYATAAGAAIGAPSLVGNGKKVLTVKADETGVEWKATGQVVGDILFSASPPATNYLPAAGNIYSQSAYPGLFSKLSTAINIELSVGQLKVVPNANTFYGIAYGAGKFVAVTSTAPRIFYSTDGLNWSNAVGAASSPDSVCFCNGRFFAFTNGGAGYQYSLDGINWTTATFPNTGNWRGVAYGNGVYVAIGVNTAAYSTNGINWTGSSIPTNAAYYQITFAFGMFITIANASTYMTSTDGVVWTVRNIPITAKVGYTVAYNNGILVAVGYSGTGTGASAAMVRSVDGINWTVCRLPEVLAWTAVVVCGGKFVVFCQEATVIAFSVDGIYWQTVASTYMAAAGTWQAAASPTVLLAVNLSTSYIYQAIYPYDPATQFATPVAEPPVGTKAYIKYQE